MKDGIRVGRTLVRTEPHQSPLFLFSKKAKNLRPFWKQVVRINEETTER